MKRIKPKFRINDIVLTKRNTLAIVKKISFDGYAGETEEEDYELAVYSVDFISEKHTKLKNKFDCDYCAWHDESSLKLVARTQALDELINLTTNYYNKFGKKLPKLKAEE